MHKRNCDESKIRNFIPWKNKNFDIQKNGIFFINISKLSLSVYILVKIMAPDFGKVGWKLDYLYETLLAGIQNLGYEFQALLNVCICGTIFYGDLIAIINFQKKKKIILNQKMS